MWIDSHAHVTAPDFDPDRELVLDRASAAGVDTLIAIGSGYSTAETQAAIRLAEADPRVFATAGVHPHDARGWSDDALPELRRLLTKPRVVAVGECGLDYYYDNSPREAQRHAFAKQVVLARELDLPVVIHVRCKDNAAYEDLLAIWKSEGAGQVRGVAHCFSGTLAFAKQALDAGLSISFSGILTFKKADELRATAKALPLDRLLVETDAPFLAPHGHRGKRNEPAFVAKVGECLAEVCGLPTVEMGRITSENTRRLFRLPAEKPST